MHAAAAPGTPMPNGDVLAQAHQQQEEDRQRQAHQAVLDRVDRQLLDQLEHEEADEGQQHEQDAVLARAIGLRVDVDRIDQRHAHRIDAATSTVSAPRIGASCSRRRRVLRFEELRLRAGRQRRDLPLRAEALAHRRCACAAGSCRRRCGCGHVDFSANLLSRAIGTSASDSVPPSTASKRQVQRERLPRLRRIQARMHAADRLAAEARPSAATRCRPTCNVRRADEAAHVGDAPTLRNGRPIARAGAHRPRESARRSRGHRVHVSSYTRTRAGRACACRASACRRPPAFRERTSTCPPARCSTLRTPCRRRPRPARRVSTYGTTSTGPATRPARRRLVAATLATACAR